MLRSWLVYYLRSPQETTDNNCEAQWCFFEPADLHACPLEVLYDNRIDWLEIVQKGGADVLALLLDAAQPWPGGMLASLDLDAGHSYACSKAPDLDEPLGSTLTRVWTRSAQIGCVPLRVAMDLVCSAADASQGLLSASAARLLDAALLATLCVDCDDGWWLPLRPAGLWRAAAAAALGAAGGGGEAPRSAEGGLGWWREAMAEAMDPSVPAWEGPEVAACPAELEGGVALSCRGIEVAWQSRLGNLMAPMKRHFLRACRSTLQYRALPTDLSSALPASACAGDQTLIMLPHADLIGHLINGLHWFMPLVWAVHQEFGGPSRVMLAVIDHFWIDNHNGRKLNVKDFESRANPRFFMPLLPLLSDSPVLHLSELALRPSCPSVCMRRAVWGFPQLSAHQGLGGTSSSSAGGVFGRRDAIYADALQLWAASSSPLRRSLATDYFTGPRLRAGGEGAGEGARAVQVLVIQRARNRRLANLDEVVELAAELPLDYSLVPKVAVFGEGGIEEWKSITPLEQIGLAWQSDILIGPSGNELGLSAFMRRGAWLVDITPPAIEHVNRSEGPYEATNCIESAGPEGTYTLWDLNPGSIVGHTARRAGVHHACLRAPADVGHRLDVTEVASPHWRFTPSVRVPLEALREVLASALEAFAEEGGWLREALGPGPGSWPGR